jgi:NAD(P)-dependent dehydrogenase (short-subunit alcohol dehydrogenase family)
MEANVTGPGWHRNIVVTGVSRGIGRAMVEGFAAQGHTVFGCARSAQAIAELARGLPAPHRFDVVDVSDAAAVERWAQSLLSASPPPDLLVNNAGIINELRPLWEVGDEEFRSVIGVNVIGIANVVRAFVPAMVDRGHGVVVNMSSGWGRSTSPRVGPYCTSKWALEGYTRSLAQELPEGMAAVAVSPGVIDTDMLRTAWGEGASAHPSPRRWAARGVGQLLALDESDNGASITIG